MKKKKFSSKEKVSKQIVEKRTELVAEFFAKPSKKRKAQLQKEISELDEQYRQIES